MKLIFVEFVGAFYLFDFILFLVQYLYNIIFFFVLTHVEKIIGMLKRIKNGKEIKKIERESD